MIGQQAFGHGISDAGARGRELPAGTTAAPVNPRQTDRRWEGITHSIFYPSLTILLSNTVPLHHFLALHLALVLILSLNILRLKILLLLSYKSHAIKFTHFTCAIQLVLVYSWGCTTSPLSASWIFPSPQKEAHTHEQSLHILYFTLFS